jgi:hypothetical protein
MATIPNPLKTRRKSIGQRQLELRNRLWPGLPPEAFWTRQTHDGFTTLPKAMPLMMSIMDDLANGQPVSSTYLELWCRAFDECFVTLSKPRELAFHSGFFGQRAERTWKARLNILAELGFIALKEGPSGPASYALIYNPYRVIQHHFQSKTPGLRADKYHALLERAIEIGDESLTPAPPKPPPLPPKSPPPAAGPMSPELKEALMRDAAAGLGVVSEA